MFGGLEIRRVGRVYGADGAVQISRTAPSSPKSNIGLHSTIQYTACPKTYVTNFSWLFPTPN
jgi:hypothetical protein